jgi:hypothetical protein
MVHAMNTLDAPTQSGTSRPPVIQLRFRDGDQTVVVEPDDEDRFNLRVKEAIEGCKLAIDRRQVEQRVRILLNELATWKEAMKAAGHPVDACYLTIRDGHLTFIVVQSSLEHNPAFEDALSDLDWKLAWDDDLKVLQVQVFALPKIGDDALAGFLDQKFNVRF